MDGWPQWTQERDRQELLQLLSVALSKCLPELQGKIFLLRLFATTLDLRVQATTARAFGDIPEAEKLDGEAALMDEKLDIAIQQYSSGGSVCFVLENNEGMLVTKFGQFGMSFHLWTEANYAHEINEGQYGGSHRVSPMSYRELQGQLDHMQSIGMQYVALDRRMSGDGSAVPVSLFRRFVEEAIKAVESSEYGRAIKQGLEE